MWAIGLGVGQGGDAFMMRYRSVGIGAIALALASAIGALPAAAQVPLPGAVPVTPPKSGSETAPVPSVPGILVAPDRPAGRPDLRPQPDRPDRAVPHGGCRYDEQRLDLIV
jgi:hypothetical protein